jgi:ABC-2 type transport system ATP-binding protein
MSVVRLQSVVKTYPRGKVRALDGLTVTVPQGAVGLLGPNGAGKTTLLKILLGLIRPEEGEVEVDGHKPTTRAGQLQLRQLVGYMPESDCLIPGQTGVETVVLLARLSGLSDKDALSRAHEVLDYVGLEEARYRPVEGWSTGMKQRLKLAQALVHDPQLLLLDEPTNGLDPAGRRHMLDLIRDLGHGRGKSLLVCTHLLADVERTCDHVIVLSNGRVLASSPVGALVGEDRRSVRVQASGDLRAYRQALQARDMPVDTQEDGSLAVRLTAEDADPLFEVALHCGVTIRSVQPQRSSLEQSFLEALAAQEARA